MNFDVFSKSINKNDRSKKDDSENEHRVAEHEYEKSTQKRAGQGGANYSKRPSQPVA